MEEVLKVKAYKINRKTKETIQIRMFHIFRSRRYHFDQFESRVFAIFRHTCDNADICWKGR